MRDPQQRRGAAGRVAIILAIAVGSALNIVTPRQSCTALTTGPVSTRTRA